MTSLVSRAMPILSQDNNNNNIIIIIDFVYGSTLEYSFSNEIAVAIMSSTKEEISNHC